VRITTHPGESLPHAADVLRRRWRRLDPALTQELLPHFIEMRNVLLHVVIEPSVDRETNLVQFIEHLIDRRAGLNHHLLLSAVRAICSSGADSGCGFPFSTRRWRLSQAIRELLLVLGKERNQLRGIVVELRGDLPLYPLYVINERVTGP
jgi:hypothetical protein